MFPVRVPHHAPPYIEEEVVIKILEFAQENPRDYPILLLLSKAGLRRDEAVNLKCNYSGQIN